MWRAWLHPQAPGVQPGKEGGEVQQEEGIGRQPPAAVSPPSTASTTGLDGNLQGVVEQTMLGAFSLESLHFLPPQT